MFTRKRGDSGNSVLSPSRIGKLLLLVFASLFLTVSLVFAQGTGIGGFDVRSSSDLAIAFDYNSSGLTDHILFYRPGSGVVYILANNSEGTSTTPLTFSPVYASGNGIGGYDLASPVDRIIAFDYDGSGKKDHLLCYRPGSGVVFILANSNGVFSPVYASGSGIGGYDLSSLSDQIITFDYNGSGLADHLLLYRPGSGTVYILQNASGTFTPVYASGGGIGGYDLQSITDQIIPFDYYGYGSADHLVMYRPGTGTLWILEQVAGSFMPVFQSGDGIGSWDLMSTYDILFPYDYTGTGRYNYLVAYRPGTGSIRIVTSSYFSYDPVYIGGGIAGYDLMSASDLITPVDVLGSGSSTQLLLYRPGAGVARVISNSNGTFSTLYENQ